MQPFFRPFFSAAELSEIFDHIPAVVWACNRNMRFTFSAGAALNKLGLHPHQVVGMRVAEYVKGNPEAERVLGQIERALSGQTSASDLPWGATAFESHVAPLFNSAGQVMGVVGIALDVTDRIAAEEELVLNRLRLEHTSALFPVTHYVVDASGMIRLSPEHREILGLPESVTDIPFDDVLSMVHPDDRAFVAEARRDGVENRRPYFSEFRLVRADGSIRHVRVHVSMEFDEDNRVKRFIGTITDMTAEVEQQQQIAELLRHDALTGLPNRAYFTERLRHDLAFAAESGELMALVLVDLDRFSRINDSLGHIAGDEYLRTIASRLRSFPDESLNVSSRLGADEFAVLLRGAHGRGDLVRRIDALRTLLEEPVTIAHDDIHVSVSIGVAFYPYDARDHTLMQKADLALSHARSSGMARTVFYDLMLAEDVASSVRLEYGLHAAMRDHQIIPYYQPIVDRAQQLCAVEALARWNHPDYGLLVPSTFLDIAEESGLIIELGERMLQQACRDLARLREKVPDLRLNVNLSSRALLSRRMIESFGEALTASGLAADALQIEVTEQSLIADVSTARSAIEALRSFGAGIVIDDFGTGYNSLVYLKSYQVDGVKLDRSFVGDMLTDRHSRAICEGVVAMARSLDLPVIAEGIETSQQRDAAIAMGCSELQGFLFGRPVPAGAFHAALSDFVQKTP